MKDFLKKIFDEKLLKFFLVGILNTIVGWGLQFLFYNVFHMESMGNTGVYIANGTSNAIASVMSYFLNKHFTFKNTEKGIKPALRFALNIAVCWCISVALGTYPTTYICKSMGLSVLGWSVAKTAGNIALIVNSCFFVVCNYFGQRFFAFKEKQA